MTERFAAADLAKLQRKRPTIQRSRTIVDGVVFDSRTEANDFIVLRLREVAGEIYDLKTKTRFPLIISGVKVGNYTSDFDWIETKNCEWRVHDSKGGYTTPLSKFRMKVFSALYPGIKLTVGKL